MGNFSRNTFDAAKGYVAVRLQQGVPLVDADFNEMDDIARNELYAALRSGQPDVAARGGLRVTAGPAGDDLLVSPGVAVVGGFPIQVTAPLRHNVQRYADAAKANADGVPMVAPIPLVAPAGPRTDTVYLDVFEREVASAEDPSLINPAIGVETAVRVRREVVVRVALGAQAPPAPAPGHAHLGVALLNRTAGPLTDAQITDIKPYAVALGPRTVSFAPVVAPAPVDFGITGAWVMAASSQAPPRLVARKPQNTPVLGVIGVALPDGARILQLRVRAMIDLSPARLLVTLARARIDGAALPAVVATDDVQTFGAVDRVIRPIAADEIVDNETFFYFVHLMGLNPSTTPTAGGRIELLGGSIRYIP